MQRLEITQEHLLLLQRANVHWGDCDYGAPAINCKRPYGNSDVERDIGEILGETPEGSEWGEDDYSNQQRYEYRLVHEQTQHVLQIWLKLGEIRTGTFGRENEWTDWQEIGGSA